MFTQAEVSDHSMINLGDVRSTNRLRLVEDEVFVLSELSLELLLKLNLEVAFNRVQEHDGILTGHLQNVVHYVLRLEIVQLGLA